jgi:S-adenosylmethionine hydrolase
MLQCQGSKNSSFTKVIVALLVILSTLSMLFAAGRPNALLFLTDFGLKDGAVSAMKGVAFGVDPDLRMFDVTHDIPAFSVWEGAYRLKQTVEYWPANTVFVCVVDPGVGTERNPIVLKTKTGYYLVGPDNGLFSLVAEDMGIEEVRIIDVEKQRLPGSEKSYTFHGRDIFAYVGARLASGQIKFEDVGPVLEGDIVTIPYQKPTIEGNTVMGNIPVLDIQYGNVWSNIPDELFEMLNPQFGDLFYVEIFEDNNLVFEGEMPFVNSFGDVPEGDTLIYYNSLLNVSVAINMDNFSEVYGVYPGPEWTIKLTKILSEVSGTVSQIDKYGNVRTDIPADALTKEGFEVGDIVVIKVNDHLIQAPFVTTYGDVDRGKPLIRISDNYLTLAINYGNFGETYSLEVGDPVTIQLLKKGAYKSELEIRHLVKTNNRQDYESDEVFANFREVTVGKIGKGKLYRSSHPSIDDPRSSYASQLMKKAGIRTVINLSDSQEELLNNLQYSDYYRSIYEKGNLIALNMGVDPMSEDFANKLREGLLFMIEKEPPYLIHCVEGKDRAGITVALLEAIMDASVEEIYKDYVKSYENYFHVKPGTPAYDAIEKIIADLFKEINNGKPVDDSNIKQVAMKYLTEKVGLTQEQIAQLQEKLK